MKAKLRLVLSVVLILFIVQLYFHIQKKDRNLPVILWWTFFDDELEYPITCGQYECLMSARRERLNSTKLAAIAFYATNFSFDDLPLPRGNRTWAIFSEESSRNTPWLIYEEAQSLFNATSTFSRYSHFPFVDSENVNLNHITSMRYYVPLILKNKKKLSPVLYLQSICNNPMHRDKYVKELMKYINVDSYGKCLNNKEIPDIIKHTGEYKIYQEELMRFVAEYKFVITIENCNCSDYISEKVWRALYAGSVPIYLGSSTIRDWLPNNKSAILFDDFKTIKDLARYIQKVHKNDTLYLQYMQHKLSENAKITNNFLIEMADKANKDQFVEYSCYLCANYKRNKIYEKPKKNPFDCYVHNWDNVYEEGKCYAKVLRNLIVNMGLSNYTRERFDEEYKKIKNARECYV